MKEPAQIVVGKHEIKVHCPHVENGACIDCLAPPDIPHPWLTTGGQEATPGDPSRPP